MSNQLSFRTMSPRTWITLIAGCSLLLLSGCDAVEEPVSESDLTQVADPGETSEEAPAIFQVSERGLWDGRPSFGGIWVAHTDVREPMRVLIRNEETGLSVTGALFRREVDWPNSMLQVSSDAAKELEMLAGQPAALQVVALVRQKQASLPTEEEFSDAETEASD